MPKELKALKRLLFEPLAFIVKEKVNAHLAHLVFYKYSSPTQKKIKRAKFCQLTENRIKES